jgi:hypothetical protein
VSILNVSKKWSVLSALALVAIALGVALLGLRGQVACLIVNKHLSIEVNGMATPGEILTNRNTAIVTRRDVGKKHSYQLLFEGDTDSDGDMGSVVDCHQWVAPRLPFLLETRSYPPCNALQIPPHRWSLFNRDHSMQFVAPDHSTISVVIRD